MIDMPGDDSRGLFVFFRELSGFSPDLSVEIITGLGLLITITSEVLFSHVV
jgi:hypothetical protein